MNIDCRDEFNLKNYMPQRHKVKELSNLFYAFSDDTRLRIIILLTLKTLCVGDISLVLNINQTTVSHQLKILKSFNIVACDKVGKNVVYYIANPTIEEILNVGADCI